MITVCVYFLAVTESASVSGKLFQDENHLKLQNKGFATKKPLIAAKRSANNFSLPPAGMISNMIHVNSLSHKKKIEEKRSPPGKERKITKKTMTNEIAGITKPGTRVNTLFSSHNWGT